MPANYDLTIWRGNDFSRTFRFKDGASAFNLTGSTLIWRAAWSDGEFEQTLAVATPSNGEAVLSLTPAQTRALPEGRSSSYEIERRIGGQETTLIYGAITVTGGVNDDA